LSVAFVVGVVGSDLVIAATWLPYAVLVYSVQLPHGELLVRHVDGHRDA
jgi:hypothetical protein